MKKPMSHAFSQVPHVDIPRSQFNRSHNYKTTMDAGYLIPILIDEVLPGDTFNVKASMFGRLSTPLVPFMDNLYLDSFFFFVPNRLLWDNWKKFNGEQTNPGDSTDFTPPYVNIASVAEASLADYFGLPINTSATPIAFFHRAYNRIWNEWFRDENLQNSAVMNTGAGPDAVTDYPLRRRGKRHDYFTSCLPWPQKGPAVAMPLGSTAPVLGIGTLTQVFPNASYNSYETGKSVVSVYANAKRVPGAALDGTGDDNRLVVEEAGTTGFPNIRADLSAATAATINSLRQAFQIQRLYERDARGGTRYTEIVRSHFGVTSPDARLQRPEYLGGGSAPISVHPVPQTSGTVGGGTPQGNLAGFGAVTANNHGFTKSFTEHGVIIGLASVRADLNYQQGRHRMWDRKTRFDFYWPALSHIGEQAVLNQEIYVANTATDLQVFGYQERYAEYRYKPNLVTGKFRSTATGPLDMWHLAQSFLGTPVLGDTFIQENPPLSRVIAVPSQPALLLDVFFQMTCARPMPTYSVPGMIDHF